MRSLIKSIAVLTGVLVLTLIYSQESFAQGCVVTGMTPAGGDIVNCSGTETNGLMTTDQADDVTIEASSSITAAISQIIQTLGGDDKVTMNGGTVFSDDVSSNCIELGPGNTEFHMLGGSLLCGDHGVRNSNPGKAKITIDDGVITANDECINTRAGDDEITIKKGEFTASDAVIQSREGNDKIIITGGRLTQTESDDNVIRTDEGNDHVSVSNAIIDGSDAAATGAISTRQDNDTVKLGTGAEILGLINGGDEFDTLVFEMEVPEEAVDFLCTQILSRDPGQGSITINLLFYEWENFEVLQCNLQPIRVARPIPTLSEWGLIAMAGVLGIIGLLALRRRKVAV